MPTYNLGLYTFKITDGPTNVGDNSAGNLVYSRNITVTENSGRNDDILDDNNAGQWANDGSLEQNRDNPYNVAADRIDQRDENNNVVYAAYKHPLVDSSGEFVGWAVNRSFSSEYFLTFAPDPNETYTVDWSILPRGTAQVNSGTVFYSALNTGPPAVCFASGTMIRGENSDFPIEALRVGQKVRTLDNGLKPIRWIGSRKIIKAELRANPKLYPIRISAGALADGMPAKDLIVSRQHRILVRSKIAQRMFGEAEVLVPAVKLLGLDGVEIVENIDELEYFHILFDKHEVILADHVWAESFYLGKNAITSLSSDVIEEIKAIFPDLLREGLDDSARPIIKDEKKINRFVDRHTANAKPAFESFIAPS